MIYIFHHIYPFKAGEQIAEEQKNRLYRSINQEFIYFPNTVNEDKNELSTLKLIQNEVLSLDDSDFVFYLHTKSATKKNSGTSEWREYMEKHLIDGYQNHIHALDSGFNTSGCLMGIPFWSENIYGGNFWWATVKYLKTIKIEIDPNSKRRYLAEWNFISKGDEWKPFSIPANDIHEYKNFSDLLLTQIYVKLKRMFSEKII
jgi:hypothetical protein